LEIYQEHEPKRMMSLNNVKSVRDEFSYLLSRNKFVKTNREASMTSIVGSKTIEIVNASFIASEPVIFGSTNDDYVKRETAWYDSMSRNVNHITGGAPKVWQAVAASDGTVNSNYGWCIYSMENGLQFENVVKELKSNDCSRRAVMIYTRPSMWKDYNYDGRSDFMCTNDVQYLIRDGRLDCVVQMRSNDSVIGFKNDFAWQKLVLERVSLEVGVEVGKIMWNVGSLHVYERNFYLVDHFTKTGCANIGMSDYRKLYPNSPYLKEESR
jgi:thymidylate synthase